MRARATRWRYACRRLMSSLLGFVVVCPSVHGLLAYGRPEEQPYLREVRIESLSKSILAFDIDSGSDLAAAALSNLHVRVWRLESGQLVNEFSLPEPPTDQHLKLNGEVEPISLRFSPDGTTLAVSFLNVIHLYQIQTWVEVGSLRVEGEDKLRPGLAATPITPELTPRTSEEAQAQMEQPLPEINQTMRNWAAERHLGDGRTRIRDFAFTPDGLFILASYCRGACWLQPGSRWDSYASGRDPVRLWDLHSTRIVWEKLYDPQGVVSRVVPLPDGGRFIAVDSELGRCAVGSYDLGTGKTMWTHQLGACNQPPSIVVLPGGRSFITNRIEESGQLALKDAKEKQLWRHMALYDAATGVKTANLADAGGIATADISTDGRWLVSVVWMRTQFQVWDLRARKIVIRQLPNGWKRTADHVLTRVRFSPDDHWLVIGSDVSGDLAIYEIERLKT